MASVWITVASYLNRAPVWFLTKAVWICIPKLGQKLNLEQYGDILINQHWAEGDAAVSMPGYDVKILPPSGIAQLVIYEAILRAAGARRSTSYAR